MLNEIERGQLASTTVQCFTGLTGDLANFPGLLKKVIEERAWERRSHNGRLIELPNLRALITEMPIAGWGQDPERIRAVLHKTDPEVELMFEEAMRRGPGEVNQHTKCLENNVHEADCPKGNTRSRALLRLSDDRPDLLARVEAGMLSPHAAMVEAGFRRRTITVPVNPAAAARAIFRNFNQEDRLELAARLLGEKELS